MKIFKLGIILFSFLICISCGNKEGSNGQGSGSTSNGEEMVDANESSSQSANKKMISPTSVEFTSGDLARYIVVGDEEAELTYSEKDGVIPAQYIRLAVPLKLIKSDFQDVDPRDIDFNGLLSVAIINLIDGEGNTIQDLSVKKEDLLKLKKLLTQEEGATETIMFEGEFHNSQDAPTWFKDADEYTPYMTANPTSGN